LNSKTKKKERMCHYQEHKNALPLTYEQYLKPSQHKALKYHKNNISRFGIDLKLSAESNQCN